MTAKEYLSQARYLDGRINSKIQQVSVLNALATKCTSTLSDMPKSATPNHSSLEETICKIIDLENEINRDIDNRDLSKIRTRHVYMIPDSDINETTMSIIFERCIFIRKGRGESAQVWCYLFKQNGGRTNTRRMQVVGIADKIMQSLDKMYEAVPERDPLVYGIEGQEISWSKASPVEGP